MRRPVARGRHRSGGTQPRDARPPVGRTAGVLLAVAAAAAVCLSPLATASSPPGPVPGVRLPSTAEALAAYVPQVSCDPVAKPGVVAFERLMLATYKRGSDGGITRACDEGTTSEHKEGRAWDWMLSLANPADAKAATEAVGWLLAPGPHGEPAWNARRLGVMYVIWDDRIWGAYRASDGWRPYSGESAHKDHVHFSFSWAGAMKRTSWWTGTVAAPDYGPCVRVAGQPAPRYSRPNPVPCPPPAPASPPPPVVPPPYAAPGATGPHVVAVQRALRVAPVSGWYGPVTTRTVQAYQRSLRLPPTGVVDQALAWRMHLAGAVAPPAPPPPPVTYAKPGDRGQHVLAVQRLLRVSPQSGWYGPVTTRTVQVYQRAHHLPATGVVDERTAVALKLVAPPKPLPPYAVPGQRGARVQALQRALRVRPVSGWYGPVTTRAVAAFQRAHHLPATGVADHVTAAALRLA